MEDLYHQIWEFGKVDGIRFCVMATRKSKIAEVKKKYNLKNCIPVQAGDVVEIAAAKDFKWNPRVSQWRYTNQLGMRFVILDE